LMIGLEMRTQPTQYIKKLQENRLIGFKAGLTVVRFLPPYLITEEDIGFAVEALRKAAEGLTVESKALRMSRRLRPPCLHGLIPYSVNCFPHVSAVLGRLGLSL
jgi:hypothetical protein